MRGRANDPNVAREKATKHANRRYYCSCGTIVHGNGGKTSHRARHELRSAYDDHLRADERHADHRYIAREDFGRLYPGREEMVDADYWRVVR